MFLFLKVFSLPVVFAITIIIIIVVVIVIIVVIDSHFRTTVTQTLLCSRTHRAAQLVMSVVY